MSRIAEGQLSLGALGLLIGCDLTDNEPVQQLLRAGADLKAKYVGFICADGYYSSIDMPTALHPQTIMAFTFADQILPRKFGYPMKIRIPTKLGFKNPKFVVALSVTNNYPGGFWEDYGYNWFSGS